MPTYEEIRQEVYQKYGYKIPAKSGCWIAEVKRKYGLTRGPAPNAGMGKGGRPCPRQIFTAIEKVLQQHGVIP